VEVDASLGVTGVEVILHVLGVEALVGDGITEEYHGVTVFQVDAWGNGREGGRRSRGDWSLAV
jgi:hypothetical protein